MRFPIVLRRKLNSLSRRLKWTVAPARPVRAWISPTTICNLRCRICSKFNGSARLQHMSEETYAVVRRELLPYLGEVILTGVGEPFMAPLLPAMLDDCERQGARVSLTTNALFWDEQLASRLARMGARVVLSVDGADEETLVAVRQGLKFDRFCETLEKFGRLKRDAAHPGFELFFNVVLLRMNLDQLGAIVEWAKRLGVDCIWFGNFSATGCLDEFAEQSLETHPEIVNPALDKACAQCERLGIAYARPQFLSGGEGETKRNEGGRLLQCSVPWWGIYVEADGTIFPCCQWWPPIGNIHDAPFGKIWNGPAYREIRRGVNSLPLPPSCRRCVLGERRF